MKYEIIKFKDKQVASKILENGDLTVKIRGNSYEDLFAAASVKEAWDNNGSSNKNKVSKLEILCLIGQRSDRRFNSGESFDLKIIANFINEMSYDEVHLFHPHSSIALALIHRSKSMDHFHFVQKTYEHLNEPILISPDAGAYKTTHEIAEKLNANLIPSNKVRVDGNPLIRIQGDVKNQTCLIVDDLADGGRTFKYLADELKRQGAHKVYLYVSHGQFNHGFSELKESLAGIFCTNSFRDIDDDFVTQYKVID